MHRNFLFFWVSGKKNSGIKGNIFLKLSFTTKIYDEYLEHRDEWSSRLVMIDCYCVLGLVLCRSNHCIVTLLVCLHQKTPTTCFILVNTPNQNELLT